MSIQSKTCIINKVNIKRADNQVLNILGLIRGFTISETMLDIFTTGRVLIEDQHNIREKLPIKGDERIEISWMSIDKKKPRTQTFMIASIEQISTLEENKLRQFSINLVDENYLSFIEKEYYVSWNDKTNSQMITDLLSYHGLSSKLIVKDSSPEILSYLNTSFSSLRVIEEIEHLTEEPFVFYQRDNSFEFNSFKTILLGKQVKKLTTKNITVEQENVSAVKRVANIDVIDNIEMQQKGINGYKY